ncbi:MAG: DNA-binding protein [Lachnospiraceae bacterium]|nr:DNA-binding protein [Lachnospiraceae bacterium]
MDHLIEQLEEKAEYARLFDFYGELLKSPTKEMFADHFMNDLSLSEVAENYGVTRQAVHDALRRSEKRLLEYEKALRLSEKYDYSINKLDEISELAHSSKCSDAFIKKLGKITEEIRINGF